jgi:methylmalonyl-CoA epimerase
VVLVAAALARGITELGDAVRAFQTGRAAEIEARRRRRAGWRLRDALTCELHAELDRQLSPMAIEEGIRGIHAGEQDPSSAARALVASAFTPLGGLDHVGVAVEDPAALAEFFEQAFGISAERPETVESQQVRVRFLPTGSTRVEVIEPTAETSSLMKFLKARGPGLHHLAFKVPDLEALLGRLAANGVRLIDRVPRRGAENTMIAFVHPSSAGGVLIELVQSGARPVPSA